MEAVYGKEIAEMKRAAIWHEDCFSSTREGRRTTGKES
jgi:hypothetical protein